MRWGIEKLNFYNMQELDLEIVKSVVPDLTQSWSEERFSAALFCLDHNGHPAGTKIRLVARNEDAKLMWQTEVDQRIKNTYKDKQVAAEFGGEAMAVLFVSVFTDYKLVERSVKSTGIDYWLAEKSDTSSLLIYQHPARLEVSGLMNGTTSEFKTRIKKKKAQTKRSEDTKLPAYIAVTDFGEPRTMFEKV